MRQLGHLVFVGNNLVWFHLWCKETILEDKKGVPLGDVPATSGAGWADKKASIIL